MHPYIRLESSLLSAIERNGLEYSSDILHGACTSPWKFPTEKLFEIFSVDSEQLKTGLTSGFERMHDMMQVVKKAAKNISVSGQKLPPDTEIHRRSHFIISRVLNYY